MWHERYSFSQEIKRRLLEESGYRCTICGCLSTEDNPLTFHHHHVWKYEAKLFRLPSHFIACEENGLVVCLDDHVELHRHQHLRQPDDILEGIGIIGQAIHAIDTAYWQSHVSRRQYLLHRLALRS